MSSSRSRPSKPPDPSVSDGGVTQPLHAAAQQAAGTLAEGELLTARHGYRVERRLGRGTFGSVYLARCLDPGPDGPPERVAVKVLGHGDDSHALTTLKRELASLLAIRDARVPAVLDWNTDCADPFVVLPYFPAGSLADAWSEIGRLDEKPAWRLLADLLSALCAAHRAGILHLDVKPSNVLLDGRGGYVLTDFGVSQAARMSKGLLHQGGLVVGLGTHGYRAPEQHRRNLASFDLRTDLWGVGATVWALYAGIDLNRGPEGMEAAGEDCVFGLPPLSRVRPECPPSLEETVMGLLYVDPRRRPGGASEVLGRLRRIAGGVGLDSSTRAAVHRQGVPRAEIQEVLDGLVDPLWSSICRAPEFESNFALFRDGEVLSERGDQDHHSLLLLRGRVQVERAGRVVDVEGREGTLLGSISTLTGAPRKVTLRADGDVYACLFNEAELEQVVSCNPSVAVRLLRSMARRIAAGPPRHED